jgi:hypothetical protein
MFSEDDDEDCRTSHWTERGRATSVVNSDALGRPRRSVLALCATVSGSLVPHDIGRRRVGTLGVRDTYAHFRHAFTAVHFVGLLLAPPAVAMLVGHIMVDEAMVGPDAGRPFDITSESWPNKNGAAMLGPR